MLISFAWLQAVRASILIRLRSTTCLMTELDLFTGTGSRSSCTPITAQRITGDPDVAVVASFGSRGTGGGAMITDQRFIVVCRPSVDPGWHGP